jgi:hypothetical protein
VLVLTDTALAFFPCLSDYCDDRKNELPWKDPMYFSVPLARITGVQSSSQVRGPGVGGRIMLGLLAGDRTEGMFAVVHETDSSAEVPLFKLSVAQAGALDAKLRYRLARIEEEATP